MSRVHVGNLSQHPFQGWIRRTVDNTLEHESGRVGDDYDGCLYVLGRYIGKNARVIDIYTHLDPGERKTFDLTDAEPEQFDIQPLPADVEEHFGRPALAGVPLQFVSADPDGACYRSLFRARIGRMFVANLWLRWYPDAPGWAWGEVVITCSNPSVPDMGDQIPEDFDLTFGNSIDLISGRLPGGPIIEAGTQFGDGQCRSLPLVLVWPDRLRGQIDIDSAGAAASLGVCGLGIEQLYPTGNPASPIGDNAMSWARRNFTYESERLHDWGPSRISIAPRSMNTGRQYEQVFPGWALLQGQDSLGCDMVHYFAALAQSKRPCHHLEADGFPLWLGGHPELTQWVSRPHWHKGQSPDQLGKLRGITELDTHGYLGPDDEHWLIANLAVSAYVTGSEALQWQLEANAINWLYSETLDPSKTTSGPRATRAIGYAGLFAVLCDWVLEDRTLAARVVQRWKDRNEQVYQQLLPVGEPWQVITDNRIAVETGKPRNVMAYQNMMGAGLAYWACKILGPKTSLDLFYEQCKWVLDNCYDERGIWDSVAVDPNGTVGPLAEGDGAHRTGWYDEVWSPPGLWAILDRDPTNEKARLLYDRVRPQGGHWVVPE